MKDALTYDRIVALCSSPHPLAEGEGSGSCSGSRSGSGSGSAGGSESGSGSAGGSGIESPPRRRPAGHVSLPDDDDGEKPDPPRRPIAQKTLQRRMTDDDDDPDHEPPRPRTAQNSLLPAEKPMPWMTSLRRSRAWIADVVLVYSLLAGLTRVSADPVAHRHLRRHLHRARGVDYKSDNEAQPTRMFNVFTDKTNIFAVRAPGDTPIACTRISEQVLYFFLAAAGFFVVALIWNLYIQFGWARDGAKQTDAEAVSAMQMDTLPGRAEDKGGRGKGRERRTGQGRWLSKASREAERSEEQLVV